VCHIRRAEPYVSLGLTYCDRGRLVFTHDLENLLSNALPAKRDGDKARLPTLLYFFHSFMRRCLVHHIALHVEQGRQPHFRSELVAEGIPEAREPQWPRGGRKEMFSIEFR